MKNIAVILGARPNFVKAAPFFKEAKKHPDYNFTLIHTGQHFDENMSKIFFDEMEIPKPDVMFDIRGEMHSEKIGKTFNALKNYFSKNKFDRVVTFGDVNSTLAAGIASAKNNLSLVHVEAGLRSHDRRMPEEINRVIVDHLSDLLFVTEPSGVENLKKEGINESKIKFVGNIMIESIEIFRDKINCSNILEKLDVNSKNYLVVTIHRQENTDDPKNLKKILDILKEISKYSKLIFPMHPGTKKKIESYGFAKYLECFQVIDPLGYFEFMKIVIESNGVITDSGGIQEETTHLGIPCATLRDNTERPITIDLGSNKLFSLEFESVVGVISHLQRNDFKSKHIPLWDNQVAKRIFNYL